MTTYNRTPAISTALADANPVGYHTNFLGKDLYASPSIITVDGQKIIQLDKGAAGRDLADLQDDYTSVAQALNEQWARENQALNQRVDNILRGMPKSYSVAGYAKSLAELPTVELPAYPAGEVPPWSTLVLVNDFANPGDGGIYDQRTGVRLYTDDAETILDSYMAGTIIQVDSTDITYKINDQPQVSDAGAITNLVAAPFGVYQRNRFLGALRAGGSDGYDVILETTERFTQTAGTDGIVRLGTSAAFEAFLAGMRGDIDGNTASINSLSDRVTSQGDTIIQQGATINSHTQQLGVLRDADAQIIDTATATTQRLQAAIDAERQINLDQNARDDAFAGAISNHTQVLSQQQTSIDQLGGRVTSLAQTQGQMQQTDAQIQEDISALEADVATRDTPAQRDRAIQADACEILLKADDPMVTRAEVNGATVWRVTMPQPGFAPMAYLDVPPEGMSGRRQVKALQKEYVEGNVLELWEVGLVPFGARSVRVKRTYPLNF